MRHGKMARHTRALCIPFACATACAQEEAVVGDTADAVSDGPASYKPVDELKPATPGVPAPPSLPTACSTLSPTPANCCPSGFTQLTGDALSNTIAVDDWNATNYCVFSYAAGDNVRTGKGGDLVFAGLGNDTVRGGSGDDHLRGEAGVDNLFGGPGNDLLVGDADIDQLNGGPGNDTLYGGPQNDVLRPGAGVDAAYGEDGDDIFIISNLCEVSPGDVIHGGNGTDSVRSPLTQAQLTTLGVTFTSIESFTLISHGHEECIVAAATLGTAVAPGVSPDGLYVGVAPRDDGSAFVTNGKTAYSLAASGTRTTLASGDQISFAPAGNIFAVRDRADDELRVYNAAGALQSTLALPGAGYAKLFPASNYVLVPTVDAYDDESWSVSEVKVYNLNGTLKTQFNTPDLRTTRLTSTHVIHSTPDALIKTDLNGVQAWSVARAMQNFMVSDTDPTAFIAQVAGHPGEVGHFEENGAVSYTAVDGVVWDLAISPLGSYSAATVHKTGASPRIYMFSDGGLTHALETPLAYANSVWVNDSGEVFVGGQTAGTSDGKLLVYGVGGNLLWQTTTPEEHNGGRPKLVVSKDGDLFTGMQTAGLFAFQIDRSPTP